MREGEMLIEKAVKPGCLSGEVVVITGGGRGIGRETALVLGYLGASVAIAEIGDSGLRTQDDVRAAGGRALWVKTDISDAGEYGRFRERVLAEWGKVDVLINNAEAVCPKSILDHSLEEWERVFAVNCRGVFLGVKLFLPAMLERRHGAVVFMPSAQGIPYVGAYSASKAAQESLAASLAQEVGPGAGVSVITFGVGMVDTPATREYVPILASLYGMSEAAFVAMAAPGGHMAQAELVATGLAGAVVHASELHGEQVDWTSGLARIGLTAEGFHATPAAPPTAVGVSPAPAEAGLLALATAVEGVVRQIRDEYENLGVFQKQWYRRTLRHRTGMDVDGWERAALGAVAALRAGSNVELRYSEQLRRLAGHLARCEADWRGYVTDPVLVDQGIAALEGRKAAVESLISALTRARAAAPAFTAARPSGT
jgi:NAD(P)-dependent dehydrogenase (short-subunit alcohol dehydrogenase family)